MPLGEMEQALKGGTKCLHKMRAYIQRFIYLGKSRKNVYVVYTHGGGEKAIYFTKVKQQHSASMHVKKDPGKRGKLCVVTKS